MRASERTVAGPAFRSARLSSFNGRLKDEFGGRTVRVRGPEKVMCHLMFGVLALSVDQLVGLIT